MKVDSLGGRLASESIVIGRSPDLLDPHTAHSMHQCTHLHTIGLTHPPTHSPQQKQKHDTTQYDKGEQVNLWVNKVGPYHNPHVSAVHTGHRHTHAAGLIDCMHALPRAHGARTHKSRTSDRHMIR